MSEKVLRILEERRAELVAIELPQSDWSRVTEWHARTRPLIAQRFKNELDQFDELVCPRWSSPSITTLDGVPMDGINHDRVNKRIAISAQKRLLCHIDALIELLEIGDDGPKKAQLQGAAVFLVHGHNERWLQEVARCIEQFGLEVTVLREEPNEGRTIIEKFEAHAAKAGFAVVLLTGDDRGGVRDAKSGESSLRARQNVIFELGFFVGTLGRARVCALYEDGVEIPSDYSGVIFVPIDDAGSWRFALAREMKVAGLDIDLNKVV